MRKIITKKDEEKKNKRNQIILGIILVVVMFVSVFGILVSTFNNGQKETKLTYRGHELTP